MFRVQNRGQVYLGLLDYLLHLFKKIMLKCTKYQIQQAFEGCLFVHLSTIIIVLHCIIYFAPQLKLQDFDNETKHLNIILLRHIIGRYSVITGIICILYKKSAILL